MAQGRFEQWLRRDTHLGSQHSRGSPPPLTTAFLCPPILFIILLLCFFPSSFNWPAVLAFNWLVLASDFILCFLSVLFPCFSLLFPLLTLLKIESPGSFLKLSQVNPPDQAFLSSELPQCLYFEDHWGDFMVGASHVSRSLSVVIESTCCVLGGRDGGRVHRSEQGRLASPFCNCVLVEGDRGRIT